MIGLGRKSWLILFIFTFSGEWLWAQQQSTVTSLAMSGASIAKGSNVTLTASVTASGVPVTKGSVTFFFGTKAVATVAVVGATSANFTAGNAYYVAAPSLGSYTVSARYNGTSTLAKSTSTSTTLIVNGSTPSYTSLTDAAHGTSGYDFTATVSGFGSTAPTGQLNLTGTNSGLLGTSTLTAQPAGLFPMQQLVMEYYGAGILIADFDGDGIPDLAVTDNFSNTVNIYKGARGSVPVSYTFILTGNYATQKGPERLVAGDFNRDGVLDLAVTCDGNAITVLFGDGNGGMQSTPVTIKSSAVSSLILPYGIAVGEFTQSGYLDLAVVDTGGNNIQILVNDGTGHFTAGSKISTASSPYAIVSGDFNGDGVPDLAYTCLSTSESVIQVLINGGTGNFTALPSYSTEANPYAIAAGDLRGTGRLDLAVVTNTGSTLDVFFNNGNSSGTFTTQPLSLSLGTGVYPSSVAIADINGDGNNDIVIAGMNNYIYLLQGDGTGSFSGPETYPVTGDMPVDMALADLDGSGSLDLAIVDKNNGGLLDIMAGTNSSQVTLAVASTTSQKVTAKYVPDLTSVYSSSSDSTNVSPRYLRTTTPLLTVTPGASFNYGGVLVVSVNVPAVSGLAIPTGSITCLYDSMACAGTNLVGGVAQLDATGSAVLTLGTPGVGNHTVTISYEGDSVYAATTSPQSNVITVLRVAPTLSWATPAAITYGTVLSSTQLNATATVPGGSTALPGTYTYTPAAGTLLGSGTQTLSVLFTPNDIADYATATANVLLTVNKAGSSVVLTTSNASIIVGGSATWTATVTPANGGSATGTVNFYAGTALEGVATVNSKGVAQWTASGLTLGSYQVTAVYQGDSNVITSTSTALTQTVTQSTTQTTPVLSWATPTAITYGSTLSSTQLNATAMAPGGSSALPGTYTYTPAAGTLFGAGAHTLSVLFTPNDIADYATATANVSLTVNKASSSVVLTTTSASILVGGSATWTATVTPANGGSATGTVNFYAGTVLKGSATVNSLGVAQWTASGLELGSYQVTAVYQGDSNVSTSTSTALTQTVTQSTTQTTPVLSWATPTAITYGSTLSSTQLNATATAPGGSTALPGTFTYTPAAGTLLGSGTQTLSVLFTPNDTATYETATAHVSLTVNRAGSSVVLTTSNASIIVGGSATWTATVTPANGGSATGTVNFYAGTTLEGVATVNSKGVGQWIAAGLAVGSYQVTAVYLGDSNVSTSTSAALTQIVTVTTTTSTSTPDYSLTAFPATLAITAGASGSDIITFSPVGGFTGSVTLSCSGLPSYVSCSFRPATLTADGSNTVLTSTLTLSTKQVVTAQKREGQSRALLALAVGLLPLGMFFSLLRGGGRRRWMLPVLLLAMYLVMLTGCGGGGSASSGSTNTTTNKATPGVYSVQVAAIASSGTVSSRSLDLTLVITQ